MESFLAVRQSDWAVYGLPAFNDNYLWVLVHSPTQACAVIDPGDSEVVRKFMRRHNLHLQTILLTHHHPDHIGGLADLLESEGPVDVWGSNSGRIPGITQAAVGGQTADVLGLRISILDLPGHTRDHLGYVVHLLPKQPTTQSTPTPAPVPASQSQTQPQGDETCWLFCGDTLFSGGCGRLFEGTAADMHASLQTINQLPASTLCFCAHEYTLSNLRFALSIEPDNPDLHQYLSECKEIRDNGGSTIPCSLATERRVNLFLRAQTASQLKSIREAKDNFRG